MSFHSLLGLTFLALSPAKYSKAWSTPYFSYMLSALFLYAITTVSAVGSQICQVLSPPLLSAFMAFLKFRIITFGFKIIMYRYFYLDHRCHSLFRGRLTSLWWSSDSRTWDLPMTSLMSSVAIVHSVKMYFTHFLFNLFLCILPPLDAAINLLLFTSLQLLPGCCSSTTTELGSTDLWTLTLWVTTLLNPLSAQISVSTSAVCVCIRISTCRLCVCTCTSIYCTCCICISQRIGKIYVRVIKVSFLMFSSMFFGVISTFHYFELFYRCISCKNLIMMHIILDHRNTH